MCLALKKNKKTEQRNRRPLLIPQPVSSLSVLSMTAIFHGVSRSVKVVVFLGFLGRTVDTVDLSSYSGLCLPGMTCYQSRPFDPTKHIVVERSHLV